MFLKEILDEKIMYSDFVPSSVLGFCVGHRFGCCGVGFSSASGETKATNLQFFSDLAVFANENFSHDLTGTSWNLGYQKILDNGLLLGAGYQNFEVSGDKGITKTIVRLGQPFELKVKTEKLQISGIYGVIGYNLETIENLFFQPNLRIGISNEVKLDFTITSVPPFRDSGSLSGTIFGIVLPLVYQLDNWNIGAEINILGSGLTSSSIEATVSNAYQLVAGYNFEL